MKANKLITAALAALGLISSAHASGTFGTTNVVYISGSTAFRANLFNTLTNNGYSITLAPTVFDTNQVLTLNPSSANSGTSDYNIGGLINGSPYIISVNLTGSEAGLASLEGSTITYTAPTSVINTHGTITLPGTPAPTTFIDPATGSATITAAPDLAFADTSQAVSLSASLTPLTSYGIVGVIPFTWAKGVNTITDSSWNNLVNVTDSSLNNELGSAQSASFFTGAAADTDSVYLVGRNKGSGTRVNTLCELDASITTPIKQYVINNATYTAAGVLTVGAATTLTSSSTANNLTGVHLLSVGNDGFDAGSGVKTTLNSDINGKGVVTIGYLGLSDALGLTHPTLATVGGTGQFLTLNGVAENDGNVIQGAYAFWGHEYFYGTPVQTAAATVVGSRLGGTIANTTLQGFSANGAIASRAQLGGATASANSSAIDPSLMHADRSLGADLGSLFQY